MNKFLVSLSDVNLDRGQFRDWSNLLRDPDFRIRANFLERLRLFMDRLPELERDILELYYFTKPAKKQEQIAEMLNISQQTVSHRMYTAFNRIRFMMAQPEISIDQMFTDLMAFIPNRFTVDVLCDFAVTSSQTVTARNLGGVSQQRVCWHLNAGINLLKGSDNTDALFYANYFENLMRHRNILREVLAGRRRKEDNGSAELAAYADIIGPTGAGTGSDSGSGSNGYSIEDFGTVTLQGPQASQGIRA
jgi:hypothetical protein